MKDEPGVVERLVAGLTLPASPRGLQEKALRGAREALAREAGRDVWTRLWESRPLRVAWGSTVLVLLVAISVLPVRPSALPTQASASWVQAVSATRDELDAIGRLPRLDTRTLPAMGAGHVLRVVPEVETPGPAPTGEKESAS